MVSNFKFLQYKWEQLAALGELAEKYLYNDSNTALIKLRLFGEKFVEYILTCESLSEFLPNKQVDRINILQNKGLIDSNISSTLHKIRMNGNKASHNGFSSESCAKDMLEGAYKLSVWLMKTYGDWDFNEKPFYFDTDESISINDNLDHIDKLERISKTNEIITIKDIDSEKMKIGVFVRETFHQLLSKEKITIDILNYLQQDEYSKNMFGINYAFLKKVNTLESLIEQRKVNNYQRYWKEKYNIYGEYYVLCNDWYLRNRNNYINWLISIKATDIIQDSKASLEVAVNNLNKEKNNSIINPVIGNKKIPGSDRTSFTDLDEKMRLNKVAYYLSRFEHNGLFPNCNQKEAFNIISEKLNIKFNTLKNERDAFDPYCMMLEYK